MRQGLLKTVKLADDTTSRFQDNVNDAVNALAAAGAVLAVPLTSLAVTGQLAPGQSAVFYRGAPGAVLSLPSAAAQGSAVTAIVLVGNLSSGNVTLRATGNDTVNGAKSITQATGTVRMLVSDGVSRWLATP